MGGLCREVSTLLSAQTCFMRGEALEAALAVALGLVVGVEALPHRINAFENPQGLERNAPKAHFRQR